MRQRAISNEQSFVPAERIEQLILFIRGEKVMLDASLAELYGVETGALNRAVKRNGSRFPEDFMFQLTPEEVESLRCHFGISKHDHALRSQFVISKKGRGGRIEKVQGPVHGHKKGDRHASEGEPVPALGVQRYGITICRIVPLSPTAIPCFPFRNTVP
jgi:hypothetical protein